MSRNPGVDAEVVVNLDSNNYWYSLQKLNHTLARMKFIECDDEPQELEKIITHHKPDLSSVLANEPRNPTHRELVTKASKDGISLVANGHRSKSIIPEMVVNEALVFSDMFELNEVISLELIIMGSNQETRYPGMTRGPIAVLLYYDARRVLLSSLKLIVDSVSGRTWSTTFSEGVCKLMNRCVNELREADVINKCLQNLEDFNVNSEYDRLLINKALGPGKYKKQVFDMIKEIHQLYADIVFSFAAQSTLSPSEIKRLMKIISERNELDSNGCLDQITTTLLMSLFYLMDVSPLQTCDEGDPLVSKLPISIHKNLFQDIQTSLDQLKFSVEPLRIIIKFVWVIAIKTVSLFSLDDVSTLDGEEDEILDEIIDNKLFESMTRLLAQNVHIFGDNFYLTRIHDIISDFIALFPLKIKELRDKGDEEGRIVAIYVAEHLQIPNHIKRNLEKLLYLMAEIYSHDTIGLSADLWSGSLEESRLLPKCVAFRKFIRSLIDSPLPQVLHVPVLKLLTSFANVSPFNVYNCLKCTGITQNAQFSLDHFFTTLQNYFSSIIGSDKNNLQTTQFASHQRQVANFTLVNLSLVELDILCSILNLVENIVKNDRNCCSSLAENQRYSCISTLVGLLMGPVPRKLKAAILSCLSGFAHLSASIALSIWIKLDVVLPKSQIATSTFASIRRNMNWQSGIALEIEDIEPRNEEYPITIAFLSAINSLIKHICFNRQPAHQFALFDCTEFIINSILLKCNARFYKIAEEKWTIKLYSLKILNCILEIFDPIRDVPGLKAAFSVMWQILQENSLFTCVMEVIEDIVTMYGPETGGGVEPCHKNSSLYEECLLNALKLFNHVALAETEFIRNVHTLQGYPSAMLLNLATLFSNVNHRTESIDRLATLIKAISLPSIPVQIESLRLLQNLVQSDHQTSGRMLLQIRPFNEYHEDYFIHGFVDCLESEDENLCIEGLKFILICVKRDVVPRVYGFSHRLLGFDRSKSNLREPSALGQTYNSLHAILELITSEEENHKKRTLVMEIIYTLCNDPELSDTALRFFRTSSEFPALLLKQYTSKRGSSHQSFVTKENLAEVAWFLKILAIEIKTTTDNQLKTNRDSYIRTLLGENGEIKVTDLIPSTIFTHQHPEMSRWEFFDSNELWRTFSDVTSTAENVIDVRALHQKLLEEVNTVGSQLGIVQTNMIQTEIQGILQYAMALNASQEQLNSNTLYFESWRGLVETLIACKCFDIYDLQVKTKILLGLIKELINHASSIETVNSMITPLSSVILLSASSLATSKPDSGINSQVLSLAKAIMEFLEASSSAPIWNQYKRARVNFYASLLHLYRLLPPSFILELKISSRLLKKLCKDILSGHEVTKVLAISLLNESELTWARDLSNDGSLKLLIDSLVTDDKEILQQKFDVHCKAFYSFDSKMALLMKICSTPTGTRFVLHAGIIDVLSNLESFELYPYYINQSDICHKMFVSTLRLLLCLSGVDEGQLYEPFSLFLNVRGSILSDILRMANVIRSTPEGITVLTLITGILAKIIPSVNKQLQRSFMSLLNYYLGGIETNEIKIVINLLIGFVRISITNDLKPILAPSWNYQDSYTDFGPPTLGSMILLIDENVTKCSQNDLYISLIEPCLYLVWHHLNLYFTIVEVGPEQRAEVARLKAESNGIANDKFFAKIQNSITDNHFVDAMVRRLRRAIKLS
ncbi:nuclear pore complex protein Nup205 [Brevipalpus obovatus]|uniref:nuclear pore complex protein Nup205 n=1 Tax=Brevipalpus obovatus TaxID=246614 RepID=UPI003D9F121E